MMAKYIGMRITILKEKFNAEAIDRYRLELCYGNIVRIPAEMAM